MSNTSYTNTTKPVITLGGKGSTLSSTALFNISNSLSLLRIDSSAKISPNSNNTNHFPQLPDYLSPEESRASLVVILNKLLLTNSASHSVTQALLDCINNVTRVLDSSDGNVNGIVDAAVQGVCALLDRRCAGLCAVADAVVAMSCEATRADVGVVNLLSDSGDGNSDKDEVGVASDLRVFLNGSKLIGKEKVAGIVTGFVNRVPEIHGGLRCVLRTLHAKTRVGLNSGRSGSGNVVFVSSLAKLLVGLGEASWGRVGWVVGLLRNGNARFVEMFEEGCPKVERLKELYGSFQCADNDGEYLKAVHEVYCLADVVRTILSWEAAAAFVWLSLSVEGGADLFGQTNNMGEVEAASGKGNDDVKGNDKRLQKEKKKNKVVMGKGTTALVQFLKDRVLVTSAGDLEKVVKQILSFLDPKDPGFEELVDKIKDIVDSNESRRLPKLPKGTRDFAKEQMAIREKAFSIIGDVFKRHGAMALDTPAFEMRETLMGKYGEDSKLIYDLADQGGELCSLRYDLTVPFARYVAMNGLTSFKRYQIAKVYRRDNPSKGRYREFYQCDFDIAGQFETMGPDFEVIKILTELLDELNIGDYEIKLNHRKLLDGMLDICGVPPEKFRTICSSIDKLDKQSFEQIKKEMVEEKGLNAETADKIGTFVKQRGHPLELLYELKQTGSKFLENSESLQSLNELEILFRALDKSKCIGKVVLDLSLARGLDYYTGVIYEAVFKGATQVGSIAAGGRYDKLIGMFGTKQVPAVGVSLGIERVFTIMEQLQKDQNQAVRATETEILVSILGDDLSLAAELVSECWAAKLKAEYLLNKRVMKHIDRAKDSRIPWMVIVGEREINEGIVKLKNVAANEEMEVPRSTFVEELQRRLNTL